MITPTLAVLTPLSTRLAIAAAAVSLSAIEMVGIADIAEPDVPVVMLERVVIEGHRELQPPVYVAQLNLADHCMPPTTC
ncbi:MAG: hypothetical protein RLZZ598_1078 [Pseudomonadota bacterium]|jgi:hypothetical protein